MKYKQQYEGDIIRPKMKGYRMMCCDCFLIHIIDFKVIRWGRGHKIKFKVRSDRKATNRIRKRKRIKISSISEEVSIFH